MKKILIPADKAEKEAFPHYYDTLTKLGTEVYFTDKNVNPLDYDGLLMPGGGDVNPCYYNEELNGSVGINDELDKIQFSILDDFVKAKKPVLGICRGHQLINVYFGGSLIQHIDTPEKHKWLDDDTNFHRVKTAGNSFLNDLYGDYFNSNTSHHQAIKKLGENMTACAMTDDGIIEGCYHKKLPVITVQFHPERMCFDMKKDYTADGSKIIKYFLGLC